MAETSQSEHEALGLEQGIVRLREYTPAWADLFTTEQSRIRSALGDLAHDVQHVGSTAIPGIKAKPILDIAVGVSTLADLPRFEVAMLPLGYEYAYWAGLDDNLVFGKGMARTHLVHIVEYNGEKWRNYISFRAALLANRALALQYEQVAGRRLP